MNESTYLKSSDLKLEPPDDDEDEDIKDIKLECPDSTSPEKEWVKKPFTEGEDILVHDQDGLIYFGIVVEVENDTGQCLVRFGDCTERWSSFYELRRLGDPECEPEVEVKEEAESPDHHLHLPPPPEEGKSFIERLHIELNAELNVDDDEVKTEETCDDDDEFAELPHHVTEARSQLSYDFTSLVWDSNHQRNESEQYCYCGESGDWYKKMLQCGRCLQWFHQECIRALSFQLMCGDRFFDFTCTLCNGTHEEYIKRLDLNWADALHLVLFNLILSKNQKFHDLETSIVPFLKKRLKYLQGDGGNRLIKSGRVDLVVIEKLLATNKTRFKCGSENGKNKNYWGLRKVMAPPLPNKYLANVPVTNNTSAASRRAAATKTKRTNAKYSKTAMIAARKRMCAARGGSGLKGAQGGRSRKLWDSFNESYQSDSDQSVRSTLDALIKTPKDFSGVNNPFRSPTREAEGAPQDPQGGDVTPNSGSTIKRFLSLSEKESPISSGAASTAATDESRLEMFQSVEEMLVGSEGQDDLLVGGVAGEMLAGRQDQEEDHFKTPGIILSDLKCSLSNYFGAQTRIARGEEFRVKARRLTLNGDIAYLMEWQDSGPGPS